LTLKNNVTNADSVKAINDRILYNTAYKT